MTKAAIEAVQAKGHRTRQTILDAAEELFAEADYDSISYRDIAQKAGVLLGAVSYHFKSKPALFEAVVTRRADEMNRLRIDELKRHTNPSVEQILDALVSPVLSRCEEPGWRSYIRIMAQVFYQGRWKAMHRRLFSHFGETYLEAMEQALPDTPRDVIRQAMLQSIIILLGVSILTFSPLEDGDRADKQAVITFLTGGVRALAEAKFDKLAGPDGGQATSDEQVAPSKRERRTPRRMA